VTNTRTNTTRRLIGLTDEVTANPADATLVAGMGPSPRDLSSAVVLARLKPGSNGPGGLVRTIGAAELPGWSRDGQTLYGVRRVPGVVYHLRDEFGNRLDFQTYTSAIWRANADGSGFRQLLAENAYTFGPLQVSPDGHTLCYTRIANDDDIWAHRLTGNRTTSALLRRYRPVLTVERLDVTTGHTSTLVAYAARPVVEPIGKTLDANLSHRFSSMPSDSPTDLDLPDAHKHPGQVDPHVAHTIATWLKGAGISAI